MLMAAGLAGDALLEVVASIDADHAAHAKPKTAGAVRQERYRQRKASQAVTCDVTSDVTGLLSPEGSSPTPPSPKPLSSIPPSPPKGGSSPADFDAFWSIYPNRVGKRDAEKSFLKALKRADLETILAGLRRYVAKTDDRPWCNPATWLNQDRWDDAPAPSGPQQRTTGPPKKPTLASMWTEEAKTFGIIDEPASTQDRRLGASLPGGHDQGPNFARRIASA